jgi:hypothetical protein
MINQNLHLQAVPLDRNVHRDLTLQLPIADWAPAARLNAIFVAAAEFADVCRDYPIVFVKAGQDPDGKTLIAPVAITGLVQDQNLYLDGGAWRARYVPAVVRAYPFAIGRLDAERFAVCVDMSWPGTQGSSGQRVFTPEGEPTPLLEEMQKHLEAVEGEVQRTRLVCSKLQELDLLRDMRFDATMPDGSAHSVDGFLTIDETKAQALSDAQVGELHRSGLLGLIQLHWVSMGNMRRLVDWFAERRPAAAAPAVAANDQQAPASASA